MDMDAPLLMSDFLTDYVDNTLLTKDFNQPPSMDEYEGTTERDPLDQMAGIFNGMWRAHRHSGGSYRCTQRRICETLTTNQHVVYEPLVQTAT